RLTTASLDLRLAEARRRLAVGGARSEAGLRALTREKRARLDRTAGRMSIEPLVRRSSVARERLNTLMRRKDQLISIRLERLASRLAQADRLLNTLSHQAILARGFALVLNENGSLVRRAAEAADGASVTIRFVDGDKNALITGSETRPVKKRSEKAEPSGQGSLF
ncbi:exodeoxyribonuclease VII large subunit, partial [Salmonella enterica subsp. enterica]|nr:exodeoxyribonuclease VII large subunit [Salmonella enterica subsp. enterica serovar Enteritidis]